MAFTSILLLVSGATLVRNEMSGMSYMPQVDNEESQNINNSWQSCSQFILSKGAMPEAGVPEEVMIDLDGSGPLLPVGMLCEISSEGQFVTSIRHSNEEVTKVDGFQDRGSFHQVIHYHATPEHIHALLNRSTSCWQSLRYECKQSQLFSSPVEDGDQFLPYGWWVSWQEEKMDFWSGASPGSRQCACEVTGDCFHPEKSCNCDSGHEDWLQDEGDLTNKEHLPVQSLHFGDTGTPLDTKEGRFTLGQLKCSGDNYIKEEVIIVDMDNIHTASSHFPIETETYPNYTKAEEIEMAHLIWESTDFEPSGTSNTNVTNRTIMEKDKSKAINILPSAGKFILISIIMAILLIILILFLGYVHYCLRTKGEY